MNPKRLNISQGRAGTACSPRPSMSDRAEVAL